MDSIIKFIVTYWIEIGFGILISVVTYFYRLLKNYKRIIISMKNGVRSLLKVEIIRKYYEYKEKGGISMHERQIVEDLYTEYVNLGGNGIVKQLCDEINELPILNTLGGE